MPCRWCVNTVHVSLLNLHIFFFTEFNGDAGNVEMVQTTGNTYENQFVAGQPLESWISSVNGYQAAPDSSANKVVYSFDSHGNQMPIAIIIDGKFPVKEENAEIAMAPESSVLDGDHCQWIGGQEECVTNESAAPEGITEEIMDVGKKVEKMKVEKSQKGPQEVVKVYKVGKTQRRTLKNLKNRKERREFEAPVSTRRRVKSQRDEVGGTRKKSQRKVPKRRKRLCDVAYCPPQRDRNMQLPGL